MDDASGLDDIELHTLDQQEERQNNDVNTLSIPNPAGIDRRETEKDHDKVDILSLTDLNFEMESMDKLFQLQFPKIHEVHHHAKDDTDHDMIKKKPGRTHLSSKHEKRSLDALIYQNDSARQITWQQRVDEAVRGESDEFWEKTAEKTQQKGLNQTDAIFEVFTDYIVEEAKNCDKGLLWIVSRNISEYPAELLVTRLLDRGASPSIADRQLNTPLHHAARKGWTSIARKLLEHDCLPDSKNKSERTPLELAILNDHNECATFLVKNIQPKSVRKLFEGSDENFCKLKFHTLLDKPEMNTTVLAILDTMIEPVEGEPNTYTVYYNILDSDQSGRDPDCKNFNKEQASCIDKISANYNKEVVYHDAVRLLLNRKWKKYVRYRFLNQFLFFLFQTIVKTLALILAARKIDPSNYDTGVDIFRGLCEAVLICCILYNVVVEVSQFKRQKLRYFLDYYNYMDVGAIVFPLLIIPFRIPNLSVQWVFASLGYLCQNLRGFEFAVVFRSTGAYVQILIRILVQDMIPFSAIFGSFLFTFTGAFYFALRGEEFTERIVTFSNCSSYDHDAENCVTNYTTTESSSLDIHSHLTREYYHVLFTHLRVMIEGENVIDEYFGPQGYKWLSVIIYVVFLFLVITVHLNLLIAQMTDTYSNVQSDAQRSLAINRAWIVARVEHNSLFDFECRKRHYLSDEKVVNPHEQLDKWEPPPLNQVSKELEKLQKLMNQQEDASTKFRKNVMQVLTEQQQLLADQQKLIQQLLTKTEERQ